MNGGAGLEPGLPDCQSENSRALLPVSSPLLSWMGTLEVSTFIPVVSCTTGVWLASSDLSRWHCSDISSGSFPSLPCRLVPGGWLICLSLSHGASAHLLYLSLLTEDFVFYLSLSGVCPFDSRVNAWSSPSQYLIQTGCSINAQWVNKYMSKPWTNKNTTEEQRLSHYLDTMLLWLSPKQMPWLSRSTAAQRQHK